MKTSSILKACGIVAIAAGGLVALSACEWGAGDDATSWSDTFNWVNFSGAYRSDGTQTTTTTASVSKDSSTEQKTSTSGTSSTNTTVTYTGKQVYTVVHSGQNLTITDGRTGAILTGKFSSMRSASGYENRSGASSATQVATSAAQSAAVATDGLQGVSTTDNHAMPTDGDTIIGSFEVSGNGSRMVGTFQGQVQSSVFVNRTLTATLVGPTKTTQIDAKCAANTTITSTSSNVPETEE